MPQLRYTLAAFLFAASVGCLVLWSWTSANSSNVFAVRCYAVNTESISGVTLLGYSSEMPTNNPRPSFALTNVVIQGEPLRYFRELRKRQGQFGGTPGRVYFPLWYPALVFALAAVGVIRFRRQFRIRSALIGLSVVAALLGMVVAL